MESAKKNEFSPLKKIILVENNPARRKLLTQNLEAYTGSEVVFLSNADEAIEYIHQHQDCDLIISEDKVDDENTSLKIYYTVNSQKLEIPIILLGYNAKIQREVTCVEKENWQEVIKQAAKAMEINAEIMANWEAPTYYPFLIYSLSYLDQVNHTLYLDYGDDDIRPWKGPGDDIAYEEVGEKILNGHEYFFVDQNQRLKFTDELSQKIGQDIENQDVPVDKKIGSASIAFKNAINSIKSEGLTDENLEQCKQTVDATMKVASQCQDLEVFLDTLTRGQESYLYQHTLLISTLGHKCLEHLCSNKKEREQDQKRICFAAFFHDALISDVELCEIHTIEELDASGLGEEKRKRIFEHASQMAKIIQNHPSLPYGVDKVVMSHHGNPDGYGLPSESEGIPTDSNMPYLGQLFMLCEIFAHEALKVGGETQEAFKKIAKFRTNTNLKQMVEALNKVVDGD